MCVCVCVRACVRVFVCTGSAPIFEDSPLVELIYLGFTRKPGESYRTRLRSLLNCLSDVC